MESIIDRAVEKLKQELESFFRERPRIEEVEAFSWKKLKKVAAELTESYAREIDKAVYADRAGRKAAGMSVERRRDRRVILTSIGEINYERTYYALKDGTYDYPVDQILGVDSYQRISDGLTLRLAGEAKEGSYAGASRIAAEGAVSRQTVMNTLRRCRPVLEETGERRKVPVLHIDADEDHTSLQNGKTQIIPLVTVYEGIETIGRGKRARRRCIKTSHHSSCRYEENFWMDVYNKISSRYDLRGTKIYLHGDGALWIKEGLEYLPNSTFVLDCYHRNKAKKMLFAGCRTGEAVQEKRAVSSALRYGDKEGLLKTGKRLAEMHPWQGSRIMEGLRYLYHNLDAISIRYQDPEARNGGATEPHVSHVLSKRLSSRPMGWSMETLEHLVPILASGTIELIPKERSKALPKALEDAAEKAAKSLTNERRSPFLIDPDRRGTLEVINTGRMTQLYNTMKGLSV